MVSFGKAYIFTLVPAFSGLGTPLTGKSFIKILSMTANGLALGEEADFEALNCLPALNLIRSTKLHLSTVPAFLPKACYAQ